MKIIHMDNLLYTLGYWHLIDGVCVLVDWLLHLLVDDIIAQFSATLHQKPVLCYSILGQSARGILTLLRRTHHGDE